MYVSIKNKNGTQNQRKVWVVNSNTYFHQAADLLIDAATNCRTVNITAGGTFHKEHSLFYKIYAHYNYIIVEHVLAVSVFKTELIACDYSELQIREFYFRVLTIFKFKGDKSYDSQHFREAKLREVLTRTRH